MSANVTILMKKEKVKHPLLWRPELYNRYYFVNAERVVEENDWSYTKSELAMLRCGNVWQTRELAEQNGILGRHATNCMRVIAMFNDGWLPDWTDSFQGKYCVYIRYPDKGMLFACTYFQKILHDWLYFKSDKFVPSSVFQYHYLKMLGDI